MHAISCPIFFLINEDTVQSLLMLNGSELGLFSRNNLFSFGFKPVFCSSGRYGFVVLAELWVPLLGV